MAKAAAPAYDGAGNLVFDGRWFYVYDPWNRLAAVHGRGSLEVGTNGLDLEGEAGPCLERFEYDALGRRVRTVLWPESSAEHVTRHVYGTGAAVLEEYVSGPGGGGGGGGGGTGAEVLARWFVPGFSGAGFPELAAMYDLTDAGKVPAGDSEEALFYLRDALGSVVALTDESGAVVERYAYDPYGSTVVLDAAGTMPEVLPAQPRSFWHDHDLDGDIDASDLTHLEECVAAGAASSTSDWWCVLVHDRDGDRRVDAADEEAFWLWGDENYDPQGTPAPAEWERSVDLFTARARLDADGDPGAPGWLRHARVDLYDFAGLQECRELPCDEGDTECEALGDCCRLVYDVDGSHFVGSADVAAYVDAMGGPDQPRVAAGSAGGFGGSGGAGGAWMPGWSSRFGNPFVFTGQRLDPLTGLYHFWARSYDPRLGRFLQQDLQGPLSLVDVYLPTDGYAPSVSGISPYSGGEYADGMNLFAYAGSNPATLNDPFGLSWDEDVDDAIAEYYGERAAAAEVVQDRIDTGVNIAGILLQAAYVLSGAAAEIEFWQKAFSGELTLDDLGFLPFGGGGRLQAGIGRTIAKSAAARAAARAAYAGVKLLIEAHHPLPKFLGGRWKQSLIKLRAALHREFHELLRAKLREHGLPLNVGGKGGSAKDWAKYFQRNQGSQGEALRAVIETSFEFDRKHGTGVLADVIANILKGKHVPIP